MIAIFHPCIFAFFRPICHTMPSSGYYRNIPRRLLLPPVHDQPNHRSGRHDLRDLFEQSDFILVHDTRDSNLYLHACLDPATPRMISCLQWSGMDAHLTIAFMRAGLDIEDFGTAKPMGAMANDRISRRFGHPGQPSNFAFRTELDFDGLGRQIASLRLLRYAPAARPSGALCLLLAMLEREAIAAEALSDAAFFELSDTPMRKPCRIAPNQFFS